MQTSMFLPKECRDEIMGRLKVLRRDVHSGNAFTRGQRGCTSIRRDRQQRIAIWELEWVLGVGELR